MILERNKPDLIRSIDIEYSSLWGELTASGAVSSTVAASIKVLLNISLTLQVIL